MDKPESRQHDGNWNSHDIFHVLSIAHLATACRDFLKLLATQIVHPVSTRNKAFQFNAETNPDSFRNVKELNVSSPLKKILLRFV